MIPESGLPPLRVGVSPDYPPVIYRQGSDIVGLEADLAKALARTLGRPLQFVEVAWDDQIAALIAGKTDIIMSGMTVTGARQIRIEFTDPFLTLGQMALIRSKESARFPTAKSVMESDAEVGVQRGSTAEVFAKRTFRSGARVTCLEPKNAPYYLQTGRIDVFLHDGPAIIWLASENEADLAVVPEPLTQEALAWGVRKGDRPLLEAANAALAQWKTDGTLDRLLRRWLPAHLPVVNSSRAAQDRK
jgi:polar amino acid transport system substrate-binding protein